MPPGTEVLVERDGTRHDLVRAGQRAVVARGRLRRPRQQALRGPDPPDAAVRRARARRARRRWLTLQLKLLADVGLVGLPNAGKSSLLSRLTRAHAEGRRLPVHDARAGARHAPGRRSPAGDRRHPRADRGRERRRRARPRVPGPRRAHAAARARARSRAARRLGPGRQPRDRRARARRSTTRGWRRCRGSWRCRRPTSSTPATAPARAAAVARRASATEVPVLAHLVGHPRRGSTSWRPSCCARSRWRRATRARRTAAATDQDALEGAAPSTRVFRPAASRGFSVSADRSGQLQRRRGQGSSGCVARYDLDNEDALAHLERRLRGIGVIRALEAEGFEPATRSRSRASRSSSIRRAPDRARSVRPRSPFKARLLMGARVGLHV